MRIACAFLALSAQAALAANCPTPARTQTLLNKDDASVLRLSWTKGAEALLTETTIAAPDQRVLDAHRLWVRSFTSPAQDELLAKAEKRRRLTRPNSYSIFLDLYAQDLKAPGCLDGGLFARFERRYPNAKYPDGAPEFEALILSRNDELVVLYAEAYDATKPGTSPATNPLVKASLDAELARLRRSGFRYRAHLHSHPFWPENSTGDIAGTVTPSGCRDYADLFVYERERQNSGLESAWVTNGLTTWKATLDAKAFREFLKVRDRENRCGSEARR